MIGRPLALLLHEAGYDIHDQYAGLIFFRHCIAGRLGARPTYTGLPQIWKSFMTDDFTPVEYSWSWDTLGGPPKIRFSIEAIGPDAGTQSDPFNQCMTTDLVGHLGSVAPNVDWTLFDHFRDAFCEQGLEKHDGEGSDDLKKSHGSSIFMAFEMHKSEVAVKAYFIPVKAKQTDRSRLSVLSDSIAGLESLDLRVRSYDHMLAFMTNDAEGSQLEIVGIAVDCILPQDSRLKLYLRSPSTSFDSVCAIMTMGGKLNTFSQATLKDFHDLWQLTLGLAEDFSPSAHLQPKIHETAGVLYNFDIKAKSISPEPKVYIPVKHYAPNDLAAAKGLAAYLKSKGQGGWVESYMRALEGMCAHRSLGSQGGMQTYISCAVRSGQLILTSYLNPEIYHFAR